MTKKTFNKLILIIIASIPSLTLANFTISPVMLQMHKDEKITSLTLRNNSNQPINFQLRAYKVVMEKGVETTQETKDLFVSPLSFRVGAGKTQTVRVAVKENASYNVNNISYRISVMELPHKINAEGAHVQLVTEFKIPLTITTEKVQPDLE